MEPAGNNTLEGKRILITGANSGIGLGAARELASRGAEVVLACRPPQACRAAGEAPASQVAEALKKELPNARISTLQLDLGDLSSISDAAAEICARYRALDILINNAGVMWLPKSRTVDGFESHLGINHLGHFALTGHLLPVLLNTPNSRVITISSLAHKPGYMDLSDPFYERRPYDARAAYAQSKVANLLFARELGRRFEASSCATVSAAVHPGVVATNLMSSAFQASERVGAQVRNGFALFGQTPDKGARSTVCAATVPDLKNGDFFGPKGLFALWGTPGKATSNRASKDAAAATGLWEFSEKVTGVRYNIPTSSR